MSFYKYLLRNKMQDFTYRPTYYFACTYILLIQNFVIVTTGCGIVAAWKRVVPKKFI